MHSNTNFLLLEFMLFCYFQFSFNCCDLR